MPTPAKQISLISGKSDELQFIDEDSVIENLEPHPSTGMRRTVTGIASPCSCTPGIADAMVRSCSVGYLDLVDAQMVPCDVALAMLRKETPKRLVLVNRKTRLKRPKQSNRNSRESPSQNNKKSPKLGTCGKSKSLDSDVPTTEPIKPSPLPQHMEEDIETPKLAPKEPTKLSFFTASKTPQLSRKSEEETRSPILTRSQMNRNSEEGSRSPILTRSQMSRKSEDESRSPIVSRREQFSRSTEPPLFTTIRDPGSPQFVRDQKDSPNRSASSLHSQALTTLENLLNRIRELDDRSPIPSSPEMSPRLPRSSPASPAPSKKGKRNQSASPIRRHFMNSPLLGRRNRKNKNIESSDDEVNASGDDTFCGKSNYKDLETFQKAQLRQKVSMVRKL